ncbi:conserved hypothetical protein [Flavobacterium sp. 9AF]|uniref:hypothetical protein n=1 Tax=Flavobacterium sp. 9AF TaxID=2653142 RepID=UPI0012F135AD|nr:hypothetical protein [Flavobacterium sp. 9AF]VXC10601.1 conserved hypothetical protein [Flavobacterium sp. 9AF]
MSANSQDQEIDLGQVLKKINGIFNTFLDSIFDFILFIKRKIITIILLVIFGFGLGYFLDSIDKSYKHNIIVSPNFGSGDYLYAKIDLLNAKKKENDTIFLKSIGIKDGKNFGIIEIEPIIDIYKFISNKPENFELIRLMAEDNDLQKIIENDITSKNYPYHSITLKTKGTTEYAKSIDPVLKFLNDSEYFNALKQQNLQNIKEKMTQNDSTISQINVILNEYKNQKNNQKSDKLIYYNENNQINDIIKTKDALVSEQGTNKINLINSDKIIKAISTTLNIKNTTGINDKRKFVFPFIFIVIFFSFYLLKKFYHNQLNKRS